MGLPDLYPAQVGSPYTSLAAPYTTGDTTLTVVDATKLPDAPNIVCLAGDVAGEFSYTGKEGNVLQGVTALPGTPNATWPSGTYAFRGISAYDHASIVEHLTYQRSHIVEATLDLTTNHSYSGRVLEGAEAGENLVFGDLAVLAESGKFVKANPATLATLDGTIALVASDTIAAGSQGTFLLRGLIRNDSWTFSPGKELYASSGTLTHEPPATGTQIIRKVGTALTATIIEFNPSSTLHAEYLVSVLPVNTVTKDNGDVERKFFKDDFSVDSRELYTGDVDAFTWDTANKEVSLTANEKYMGRIGYPITGCEEFQFCVRVDASYDSATHAQYPCFRVGSTRFRLVCNPSIGVDKFDLQVSSEGTGEASGEIIRKSFATAEDMEAYLIDGIWVTLRVNATGTQITCTLRNDPTITVTTTKVSGSWVGYDVKFGCSSNCSVPMYFSNFSIAPSESYSDNFTTDTVSGANGRYQAVEGTVAYDGTNKRMAITAGAGVTAKTRLKSYTQLEGAYKRKLHLPATGTDGDVVAAYFGTEPTLESGFGIGAIRTAGAWNIATIDGVTVTDTGTVIADLVDGDSFYVEVERDTTHGVVWYYVYKSGKPATASGKLFNTYQEIYDGFWFKNKGAAENSIAVSEIEDRAESIVGRTNVELTEEVFNSVTGQMETRTYFKPIHRGAMLETYHDGTQEVVGTTFIDDCQWDRSAEYIEYGNGLVHDTVNACIKAAGSVGASIAYPKTGKVGNGLYFFDVKVVSPRSTNIAYPACVFGTQTLVSNPFSSNMNGYYLELQYNNGGPGTFSLRKYIAGVSTTIASKSYTMALNTQYTIQIVWIGTTISIYVNGVYLFGATDSTYSDGYFGIFDGGSMSTETYDCRYSNIGFIAASPDATNGIAACIPPIGGGARYGIEESVYIPITPGTEIPVGSAVISPNAKSTVVGTALTTFAQTPAGASASLEYATGTKACPGLSTAFALTGRHRVKADRNTLTNIGVKGPAAGTSPTVYIDSLHVRRQEVA